MKASFVVIFIFAALLGNVARAQQLLSVAGPSWLHQQCELPATEQGILADRFFRDLHGPYESFVWIPDYSGAKFGNSPFADRNDAHDDAWSRFVYDLGCSNGWHGFEVFGWGKYYWKNEHGADCGGTGSGGGESQIPEPSAYAILLGVAAFGLALRRRTRTALTR